MSPSSSGSKRRPADPVAVAIIDPSQVGEARRAAKALASRVGFDEVAVGRVAVVVTELGTNILKHAVAGELVIQTVLPADVSSPDPAQPSPGLGVEILALDRGPGMADVDRCLADDYSTAGTPGNGLGAVMRLSTTAEIYSRPGQGTVVLARIWPAGPDFPGNKVADQHVGSVTRPKPVEDVCGDEWAIVRDGGRTRLMIADGLGHGPMAATAAREAARIFRASPGLSPAAVILAMHPVLRPTRGVAIGIAELRPAEGTVIFAGVGNIAGTVTGGGSSRSLMSYNGTVGMEVRKVQDVVTPCSPGSWLILHSDGLSSRWALTDYPGLDSRAPALVAGVLYRDHRRDRDDATVVAVRVPAQTALA